MQTKTDPTSRKKGKGDKEKKAKPASKGGKSKKKNEEEDEDQEDADHDPLESDEEDDDNADQGGGVPAKDSKTGPAKKRPAAAKSKSVSKKPATRAKRGTDAEEEPHVLQLFYSTMDYFKQRSRDMEYMQHVPKNPNPIETMFTLYRSQCPLPTALRTMTKMS